MAKQTKAKAEAGADTVELIAVGTVWCAGKECLDGAPFTAPAATAERLVLLGAARLPGDEPAATPAAEA